MYLILNVMGNGIPEILLHQLVHTDCSVTNFLE